MNDAVFYALAEVAMALAGFSGIAAAFRLRGKNAWTATELRMLWFLIIDSFLVVFLSLLPIPLHLGGMPHDLLWTICTVLLGVWYIVGNLSFQGKRKNQVVKYFSKGSIMLLLLKGTTVFGFIVMIALWLSIFDFIVPRGQAMYVGGLVTLLAIAAVEFLFFIERARRNRSRLSVK